MTDEHKEYLCELCDIDPFSRDALEAEFGTPEHYLVRVHDDLTIVCRFCIGYDVLREPLVVRNVIRQLK